VHVLRTIDVKPIVVQIDAIVNSNGVEHYVLALKNARAMIGTRSQENVAN